VRLLRDALKQSEEIPDLLDEAVRIIGSARDKGIVLRLIGSCGIRLHSHGPTELGIKDIDIITYRDYVPSLKTFFSSFGYVADKRILALHGTERQIYYDTVRNIEIDVFVDRLRMCHTIDFKGRLELDYPTATVTDLLLGKTQIVKLTERDVKGIVVLLRDHDLGQGENEMVDLQYLAQLFSSDWGFYYTFTTNLQGISKRLDELPLQTDEKREISEKITTILRAIEKEPKTRGWKMRAAIGSRRKWYSEVDEVAR
jgi:hypothetical protein